MVVKAPDPDHFLRWGGREYVCGIDDRAQQYTDLVKHAAQNGGAEAVRVAIKRMLAATFRAGHALGKAEAEHALREVVSERVRAAIAGIAIEPAKCPHCAGLGCDECGDTGKYRESMRLP